MADAGPAAPAARAGGGAPGPGVDPGSIALVLGATEALLDRLPTDAFADDRLYVRAQALTEVLEAGLAAADRSGRGHGPT